MNPVSSRKVLVARIGWMKFYNGSQPGDEKPVGGGQWNKNEIGSELCNFKSIKTRVGSRLFGFAITPGSDDDGVRPIKLERIDPTAADRDEIDGVTVIFVARDCSAPAGRRQRMVGWYTNATVLRRWRDDPTGARGACYYNLLCHTDDAVLVTPAKRRFVIPGGKKGTMGQANVWYPYSDDGTARTPKWLARALMYLDAFDVEHNNLLRSHTTDPIDEIQKQLNESAGFQPNTAAREAIEDHAMRVVRTHFEGAGYRVEDHHLTKPYDFCCVKGKHRRYVEVKGTTTLGEQIIITPGEVAWVRRADAPVDLYVVRSINLTEGTKPKAKGGHIVPYPNWNPRDHNLRPVSFICRLSKTYKTASA